MKNILLMSLLISFVIFTSCKEKITNPPNNQFPEGYQQDIPWPSLADSPWPMYHSDPQSTGRSKFLGPQQGIIEWKTSFKPGVNKYITVGSNGTIYFVIDNYPDDSSKTCVMLFSMQPNGKINWQKDIYHPTNLVNAPETFTAPLLTVEGNIITGSTGGYLASWQSDGTLNWRLNVNDPILTAGGGINIGLDGTLYFSTYTSFFAVDKNGNLNWEKKEYAKSHTALSPDGNTLYVLKLGVSFDAIDKNGNLKWSKPIQCGWAFYPLVDSKGNVYVWSSDSTISSFTSAGNLRWIYKIEEPQSDNIANDIPFTIDKNGNFYFNTNQYLYSLTYDGKLRWKLKGMVSRASPLICDKEGTIFGARWLPNGPAGPDIFAVSSEGKVKWELDIGDELIQCAMALNSNGELYVISIAYNPYSSFFYSIN